MRESHEALTESRPIQLQPVPHCPVCRALGVPHHGGVADRLWNVPGSWNYLRCPDSGNLWLSPRPVDQDLGRCYPSSYFTHSSNADAPKRPGRSRGYKETIRRLVLASGYGYEHLGHKTTLMNIAGRLLALLPPVRWEATHHLGACLPDYAGGGRLLDVGCGNGRYLTRMRDYGWEVAGIEVDPAAAQVAREEHEITVHAGEVESAPFDPASFDVITCQHVLEHIADPRPFLLDMTRLLKPQGRLVVVTPNASSLGHMRFQRDCHSLDPPRHLVIHTPDSIRRLVALIPELQVVTLRTHARIARKIFLQWRVLRRCGAFRGAGVRVSLTDKLGALLFSYLETAGTVVAPVGEEIELVVSRRD